MKAFKNITIRRLVIGLLPFYLFTFLPLHAQVGTWRNHLAYHDVQQIQAAGNELFVMASNGLYQYNKADQSIYTYDKTKGLSDTYITNIRWCQQARRLVVIYDNSNIDLVETSGKVTNISDIYTMSITGGKNIYNVYCNGVYAYLATEYGVSKVNVRNAEVTESYLLGFAVNAVVIEGNNIFVRATNNTVYTANMSKNLIDPSSWQQTTVFPSFDEDLTDYNANIDLVKTLQPGGPNHNHFGYMKFIHGKLYTTSGDYNQAVPLQILEKGQWNIYQSEGISEATGVQFVGAFCFDVDPANDNHLFAGSRNGLYEYLNGRFVKFYNDANSPIEPFDGTSKEYEIISGVKFEKDGTLWILNSSAPSTSMIRYSGGTFTKVNHQELMKLNTNPKLPNRSNAQLSRMFIDSQGTMWFVNNNWLLPALYQYHSDTDAIKAYETFANQDAATVYISDGVRCVTEDAEHNIWIGTTGGPLMLQRSEINQGGSTFTQVKVPRNDGTDLADYLLTGIDTRCIAVDGAGRKWFATNGQGVYLVSADNMTQLQHFTTATSPLLSDFVLSVAIDPQSGEVFFGTDKGLCSYISDATEPASEMDKNSVWAYPNPVNPDYTGLITVVGLTLNADVKILASNGALVHEGRSNGGTFTWNGCDREGRRVASGVYMVATATSEGEKGTVCKIAIIR